MSIWRKWWLRIRSEHSFLSPFLAPTNQTFTLGRSQRITVLLGNCCCAVAVNAFFFGANPEGYLHKRFFIGICSALIMLPFSMFFPRAYRFVNNFEELNQQRLHKVKEQFREVSIQRDLEALNVNLLASQSTADADDILLTIYDSPEDAVDVHDLPNSDSVGDSPGASDSVFASLDAGLSSDAHATFDSSTHESTAAPEDSDSAAESHDIDADHSHGVVAGTLDVVSPDLDISKTIDVDNTLLLKGGGCKDEGPGPSGDGWDVAEANNSSQGSDELNDAHPHSAWLKRLGERLLIRASNNIDATLPPHKISLTFQLVLIVVGALCMMATFANIVFAGVFFVLSEFQVIAMFYCVCALLWLVTGFVSLHAGHQHHITSTAVASILHGAIVILSVFLFFVAIGTTGAVLSTYWRILSSFGEPFVALPREAQFEYKCCGWQGPWDEPIGGCDLLLSPGAGCGNNVESAWAVLRWFIAACCVLSVLVSSMGVFVAATLLSCTDRVRSHRGRRARIASWSAKDYDNAKTLKKIILLQAVFRSYNSRCISMRLEEYDSWNSMSRRIPLSIVYALNFAYITSSIWLNLIYGVKFEPQTGRAWVLASIASLCFSFFISEPCVQFAQTFRVMAQEMAHHYKQKIYRRKLTENKGARIEGIIKRQRTLIWSQNVDGGESSDDSIIEDDKCEQGSRWRKIKGVVKLSAALRTSSSSPRGAASPASRILRTAESALATAASLDVGRQVLGGGGGGV